MPTPSKIDTYVTWVRRFIRDFARPSVIIELIDTLDNIIDDEPEPEPTINRLRQMLVTELSFHDRNLAAKYAQPKE